MGKQVYLSEKDIEGFKLMEDLFDACVTNGEEYSDEERLLVQRLCDKILGEGASNVGFMYK